jgi:DNA-binding CsgD family transcriptional regulator
MSPPRKKKSSRKDLKPKAQYSYILGEKLHLTRRKDPAARENRLSQTEDNKVLAGGRRSTDRNYKGLYIYWDSLSTREQDVTMLVCKGHSDAEVAERLNLSVTTVRSYLQRVFLKTLVRNRKQLILRFAKFEFPRDIPHI